MPEAHGAALETADFLGERERRVRGCVVDLLEPSNRRDDFGDVGFDDSLRANSGAEWVVGRGERGERAVGERAVGERAVGRGQKETWAKGSGAVVQIKARGWE